MSASVDTVPKLQKAAIYDRPNDPIRFEQIPVPEPDIDDVLVKVLYSGVCHSDLHGWRGEFPDSLPVKFPLIGGHEGAGIAVKVGAYVKDFKPGDRVGIKLMNAMCTTCEYCLRGYEPLCMNPLLTGFYCAGTFQQYALIKARDAIRIPENVDLAEAAPILCAGMTVYRGLCEANLKAGQFVVVVGAGGGLGSLAVQYAKAMGYIVVGIDSLEKEARCREFGVDFFVDTSKPDAATGKIVALTNGGPHAVLNVANSVQAIEASFDYIRPRGTVILISMPPASVRVNLFNTIMRAITIKGTVVGNRQDAIEALEFVGRGQVKVPFEIFRLEDLPGIYERLEQGSMIGRAVIDLWK